jgi:chemotaxis-related protein WspD
MTTPSHASADGSSNGPLSHATDRGQKPSAATGSGDRPTDCWREIGVGGDRSCPELTTFIHCRNCPVMTDAAVAFFDRPPPDGYLDEWREVLEAPLDRADSDSQSLLVFRLADEWFALTAEVLAEVTSLRTVHKIPHRSNTVLAGMVNVRGQLLLCGSLHGLLGLRQSAPAVPQLQPTSDGKGMPGTPNHEPLRTPGRLLVASHSEGRSTRRLAFAVDEVAGVQRIAMANLRDVPSTLGKPGQRYSTALFAWQSRRVSLLAADRLFTGIHEQIPQ